MGQHALQQMVKTPTRGHATYLINSSLVTAVSYGRRLTEVQSRLFRSDHLGFVVSPSVPDTPKRKTISFRDTREHRNLIDAGTGRWSTLPLLI